MNVIKKITDIVTILGPAAIAIGGIFSAQAQDYANAGVQIATIIVGAISSIASVVYNMADKRSK